MIRLTWMQSRSAATAAAAALALIALASILTGPHLVHLYDTTVAPCLASGDDCSTATGAFLRNDRLLSTSLGAIVVVAPGIFGALLGAPLLAREFEAGTYRLAWTQSITRTRWLAVKFAVLGIFSVACTELVAAIVTWWASPLDRATTDRFATFDQRGLVPIGYAALAFALGVTAGAIIGRTVPAMATAAAALVGARVAFTQWVRPHLLTPAHLNMTWGDLPPSVTHLNGIGFIPTSSGITFVGGHPIMSNAMVLSSPVADSAGRPATTQALNSFVRTACPDLTTRTSGGIGNRTAGDACLRKLSTSFHLAVRYQPPSRYWTLQWHELAIFLTAALVLTAVCFYSIRNGHTQR